MRKFLINVNGNSYEVEVEEIGNNIQRPAPVQTTPPAPVKEPTPAPKVEEKKEIEVSAGQEIVAAPMPGNIWKILVAEGQEVKEGDNLLILEAMKMENEILAPRDGKVASIVTKEGLAVNTGDQLVIIE
ncbi:biotin/lipoyl-containing protein [Paratissierella segnis]|uniref:Biotin/lipoyl-binding protein n=1 Tax=Paratissierella segnis TaxID=2763679 RepID=A0A926EXA7_9FIRM|nr:biotin/lipoyl-containing protein [Paratissierella segnis]MBC8587950.1 biotin/lipoyl-binding protein [Paratissierella segnis]